MSLSRSVVGFIAALALVGSFVPALASAGTDSSYFNYDYCNTYPYNNSYSYNYPYNNSYPYNYQYNTCPHGTLFVYVQVNGSYNMQDRKPQDFTVSVNGQNVSKPSFPGSSQGTTVYLNGSYNVTVSPFQGYTPTYSPGCTGSVSNGTQATCFITENSITAPYPYPQYPYPQYPNYPGYVAPTVYVTPTYVPSLPNTGFEPQNGAQMAALVVLVAMAFLSLPYVRKTLASLLG